MDPSCTNACNVMLMLVVGLMVLGYNPRPRMVVGFGKCTGSQSPTAALPVFTKPFSLSTGTILQT